MSEQLPEYTGHHVQVDLEKVKWDFLSADFQSWSTFKDIVAKHTVLTGGRFKETGKDDTRWKLLVEDIVEKLNAEARERGSANSPFANRHTFERLVGGAVTDGFAEHMTRIMGIDPEDGLAKAMRHAELKGYSSATPHTNGSGQSTSTPASTSSSVVDDKNAAAILADLGVDSSTQSTPMVDSGPPASTKGPVVIDPNREPIGPGQERMAYARKLTPAAQQDREMDEGESRYDFVHRIAAQARSDVHQDGTTGSSRRINYTNGGDKSRQ